MQVLSIFLGCRDPGARRLRGNIQCAGCKHVLIVLMFTFNIPAIIFMRRIAKNKQTLRHRVPKQVTGRSSRESQKHSA